MITDYGFISQTFRKHKYLFDFFTSNPSVSEVFIITE